MLLVSWGCHISAYTSSRKKKEADRGRAGGYDDLEASCFFTRSLRAARYLRMRSDIARRFAGVSRCVPSRRFGAGSFGFAGRTNLVVLDEGSELTNVDRFVATPLTAARLGDDGAISMPNISERSSLASTFAAAGPLRFFERSDPALTIRSC